MAGEPSPKVERAVQLRLYDLTAGMAKMMSAGILGFELEAVWHSSIEFDGHEWYFDGDGGIGFAPVGESSRVPDRVQQIGVTTKTKHDLKVYCHTLVKEKCFTSEGYDPLERNCHNFSELAVRFLLDGALGIPEELLTLAQRIRNSPLGPFLQAALDGARSVVTAGHGISLVGSLHEGEHRRSTSPCSGSSSDVEQDRAKADTKRKRSESRSSCSASDHDGLPASRVRRGV